MSDQWALVFNDEAVEVMQAARLRDKRALGKVLDALLNNPSREADYLEKDDTGRSLNVILVGRWAVTCWLDHFVREIRIVKLEEVSS